MMRLLTRRLDRSALRTIAFLPVSLAPAKSTLFGGGIGKAYIRTPDVLKHRLNQVHFLGGLVFD